VVQQDGNSGTSEKKKNGKDGMGGEIIFKKPTSFTNLQPKVKSH
jgi:hypothetical protein